MKLRQIEHQRGYRFFITFNNGESLDIDLEKLVSSYVKPEETNTASINQEWGCLEFNNGKVDIEPKTLYHYSKNQSQKIH